MNHRVCIILGLLALMILLAAGCGRGSRGGNVLPQPATGTGTQAPDGDAIDAELAALTTPEGVDPVLFSHLKKALANALASVGKVVSTPPTGEDNIPANLTLTEGEGDEWTLSWEYRNIGDYDQNGTVGISDITPLAMLYGAHVGEDPLAVVVDGDGSNVVEIGDITPIAMNYGVNCAGCQIQAWDPSGIDYENLDTVDLTAATGKDAGWMVFEYAFVPTEGNWYRVAPFDSEGTLGEFSDGLEFTPPAIAPEITGVTPLSGATGAVDVGFSATVNGTLPLTYAWNFGGGADPNTSSAGAPHVTLGAPGVYDTCSVTVTNEAGEDTFPFTLTIGIPPDITDVTPITGEAGSLVVFTPTVTGDEPLTYSWDFGGGATPDTSSDAEPEVTVGPAGFYEASVAVSNSFGEDFFGFTLEITPPPIPPTILSVGPTQGHVGDEVTFVAVVEGDEPMSYDWSFGGGATPDTSTDERPDVTLSSTADTYSASLTVTNAAGFATFPFDLLLKAGSEYDETEPNNTRGEANALPTMPIYGWYCRLAETTDDDDFFEFSASMGDILHVTMTLDVPAFDCDIELQSSAGDVLTGSAGTTGTEQFDYAFDADGTYYIHCYSSGGGPGEGDYWLDIDMELYEPWTSVQAADTGSSDFGSYCSLLVGSPPGIAFYDADNCEPYFASCDTEDGLGTWTTYLVLDNPDPENREIGSNLNAGIVDGKPVVACPVVDLNTMDNLPIQLAVCSNPDGSGLWSAHQFDINSTWDPSVCEVAGRLAVAYESYDSGLDAYTASYAINSAADGSGTWITVVVDPAYLGAYYNSLIVAGGYPAIAYYAWDAGPGELCFARSMAPDGTAGIWMVTTVDSGLNDVGVYCSMRIVDGRPAISYYDDGAGEVKYAINAEADGSGAWTVVSVGSNNPATTSLWVVNGYPAIAVPNEGYMRFWQADTTDGTGGSWDYEAAAYPGLLGSNTCLNICDGQPSISYYDPDANVLRFARRPE
ncbi:PKD domain-containing protein [bacterium]|nr:PKD domain-containing protein [bacterium]